MWLHSHDALMIVDDCCRLFLDVLRRKLHAEVNGQSSGCRGQPVRV